MILYFVQRAAMQSTQWTMERRVALYLFLDVVVISVLNIVIIFS